MKHDKNCIDKRPHGYGGSCVTSTPLPEPLSEATGTEACQCKEMTCKFGCDRNHTHKTFFCDKCEPEACKKMESQSPETEEWEEKYYDNEIFSDDQLAEVKRIVAPTPSPPHER